MLVCSIICGVLLPRQRQNLDNDGSGKDDESGKDIPAMQSTENQVEENDKGKESGLAKGIAHSNKVTSTHEEKATEVISHGSKCTY